MSLSSFSTSIRGASAAVGIESGITSEENESCFPEMSLKTRITGFAACLAIGFALSFISILFLATANFVGFALMYTFGNITAMASTLFLVGPKRQCSMMWHADRLIATVVYILTMITTLIVGLVLGKALPCFILVGIQSAAGLWYGISYIPFARDAIIAFFS